MKIESNVSDVVKWMQRVEKQIPYVASVALNKTVWDLRRLERREMQRVFKNPTPYTLRAVRFKRATKQTLTAELYLNDTQTKAGGNTQATFLKRQVVGGGRRGKRIEGSFSKIKGAPTARKAFALPTMNVKHNMYGNVSGALQKAMAAGAANRGSDRQNNRFFLAKRGKTTAIWERYGRKVKGKDGARRKRARPVMVFTKRPTYRKRFKFYNIAIRHAQNRFDMHFNKVFNTVLLGDGLISRGMKVTLGPGDKTTSVSGFNKG